LNNLKSISKSLPQYWWPDIKVFYFQNHAKTLADSGLKSFLYDCIKAKIEKKDLNLNKNNIVMITRDNYDFKRLLGYIDDFTGVKAIYSMWEGYLENSDLMDRMNQKGIELEIVHTSGHAPERDLKRLVEAFKPKCIVPIHTFHPEKYQTLFPNANVHSLNDGEEFSL
jgi:ribonuclease J